MGDNLYDILGVGKDATEEEIKAAYKREAKKNHTDKGGDNDKMVAVNKAWGVLKNPEKKEHYDTTGQEEMQGFDKRFQALIQDIFIKIIEEVQSVDTMDLIDIFKLNVQGMLDNGKKEKSKVEKILAKMNKVLERLSSDSNNQIAEVTRLNITRMEDTLKVFESDISFVEDCLEVLNSYHYKFEEAPPNIFAQGGTGATFTIY